MFKWLALVFSGLDRGPVSNGTVHLEDHYSHRNRAHYPTSGIAFFMIAGWCMFVWASLMCYWCGPRAIKKLLRHAGLENESPAACLEALLKVKVDAALLDRHFRNNMKILFTKIEEVKIGSSLHL